MIADDGWPGVVVRISSRGRRVERRPDGSVLLTVEAGEEWDDVVAATVADGLGGLECLSGIPGRTGAVPVQNVGAYGVEIADALVDVDLLDRRRACAGSRPPTSGWPTARACSRAVPTRSCCGCGSRCPATRRSAPIRYAELARALGVAPGERVPAAVARETVLALRRGKGMVLDPADHDTWSAGSFFTNPVLADGPAGRADAGPSGDRVKVSAAWLIERAGFRRGHPGPGGRVALSSRHVLALTHRGGGSTADLLALAAEVRDGVQARFGVSLTPEPVLVGCSL